MAMVQEMINTGEVPPWAQFFVDSLRTTRAELSTTRAELSITRQQARAGLRLAIRIASEAALKFVTGEKLEERTVKRFSASSSAAREKLKRITLLLPQRIILQLPQGNWPKAKAVARILNTMLRERNKVAHFKSQGALEAEIAKLVADMDDQVRQELWCECWVLEHYAQLAHILDFKPLHA